MRNGWMWAVVLAVSLAGCASPQRQGGIPGVIAPGVEAELVREGYIFLEGPLGMADGGLLFVDRREADRIHRLHPDGKFSVFREKANGANGLAYTRGGDLIVVEAAAKRISRTGADGRIVELTRGDGQNPLLAPNDLIVDAKGGVYFTDPGLRPLVKGRKVHVYYLAPSATRAQVIDDQVARPNGIILSPDGKTLLVADTIGHDVIGYDVQPDGTVRNRRPLLHLRDIPAGEDSGADGMAVDRDGRIFVTSVRGVQVFDKSGQYLGTIPVPRRPTNVAFAGPGKRVLYITAREGLYRIQTLTQGPGWLGK